MQLSVMTLKLGMIQISTKKLPSRAVFLAPGLPVGAGVAGVDGGLDQWGVGETGAHDHPADSRHVGEGGRTHMDAVRIAGAFLPGDAVHDFAARRFNAAGRGAGDELELFFSGVDFSGREFGERLAKNAAALDDFKRADKKTWALAPEGMLPQTDPLLPRSAV